MLKGHIFALQKFEETAKIEILFESMLSQALQLLYWH